MTTDKAIELVRPYALWVALAASILASWYVGQEDFSIEDPPEAGHFQTKKSSPAETTSPSKESMASFEWGSKIVSSRPVLDLFGSPLAKQNETNLQVKDLSKQASTPLDPSLTFNFNYAGQVEKNGLQSVFLMDENQKVLVVPAGGMINPDWQLVQLDDNIMTLKHLGTGQIYQLKTRSTE